MRLTLAATTLAAATLTAPVEAVAGSSAPFASPRGAALGCEVMRSGFIDVRNSSRHTIYKGARIELVIVVGSRGREVRRTVVALQTFGPATYHAFAPVPRGAKSCTARLVSA